MSRIERTRGRNIILNTPTESIPFLTVFSNNTGQLLRGGDLEAERMLKGLLRQARRNHVPFIIHLQEAGSISSDSVGMEKIIQDVFTDKANYWHYGTSNSNGQINLGHDQYTIYSTEGLSPLHQQILLLPQVPRQILRRNQRAAQLSDFLLTLPNGSQQYLIGAGFHYDLDFTKTSREIKFEQAKITRRGVDDMIDNAIENGLIPSNSEGIVIFSCDANTHGYPGLPWHRERVEKIMEGLGPDIVEDTKDLTFTASLARSIEQEILSGTINSNLLKRPITVFTNTVGDAIIMNRKLDHQFHLNFIVGEEGKYTPIDNIEVIDSYLLIAYQNADHFPIGTLYGIKNLK